MKGEKKGGGRGKGGKDTEITFSNSHYTADKNTIKRINI